jgi:hypothetical protein
MTMPLSVTEEMSAGPSRRGAPPHRGGTGFARGRFPPSGTGNYKEAEKILEHCTMILFSAFHLSSVESAAYYKHILLDY